MTFLKDIFRNVLIKWPNDIYVKNDKIAGILIENSIIQDEIEHVIAGIGLNINQEKFISNAPNPVSLKILTGKNFDLDECLSILQLDLDKRYKQLLYRRKYLRLIMNIFHISTGITNGVNLKTAKEYLMEG